MVLAAALCCAGMAAQAVASVPFATVSSPGPLFEIFLGNELSSQIGHTTDGTTHEVYPPDVAPADYGTFLVVADTLYAPDFDNHDGSATASIGAYVPMTPVSQSGPTGSGTALNPYRVVTVVDVGTTGLRVTQTDSYVTGQESYRTDIVINNTSGATVDAILYRALDCFLGGSDSGFGFVRGTAVACSSNADNSPPGRIEMLLPISGGNNYYEAFYNSVWTAIGAHAPFDDTCECASSEDNGIGISWNISVPAGGSVTRTHLTIFSPEGSEPLTTTKTADSATSSPGECNGYTITVANPNPVAATLNSIIDLLPAGFSYVSGSTTGVTTANPAVAGQQLTWSGPFNVPAAGSVSLHFSVTVTTVIGGPYTNEATADAGAITVVATGPTAPVVVANADPDCSAAEADPHLIFLPLLITFCPVEVDGVTDPDGDPVTITITSIRQDEQVGLLHPDGTGVGSSTAYVRAEANLFGNGRVYHIGFNASDGHGGTCSGSVKVGVIPLLCTPPAVDNGSLYDSTH